MIIQMRILSAFDNGGVYNEEWDEWLQVVHLRLRSNEAMK